MTLGQVGHAIHPGVRDVLGRRHRLLIGGEVLELYTEVKAVCASI